MPFEITVHKLELMRAESGYAPAVFARSMGITPEQYDEIRRAGRVPRVVKWAARGISAEAAEHRACPPVQARGRLWPEQGA